MKQYVVYSAPPGLQVEVWFDAAETWAEERGFFVFRVTVEGTEEVVAAGGADHELPTWELLVAASRTWIDWEQDAALGYALKSAKRRAVTPA